MTATTGTKTTQILILTLILAAIALPSAAALNTHLNISILETVNENVTFARNFLLEENRTYLLIEGVITVTNPGTETVFDSYIRLDNTENTEGNFIQTSGRPGYQLTYAQTTDNITNLSTIIDNTWTTIRDIDEDGTADTVRVNDTHIIFNITSEYELHAIAFYNSTHTNINISTVPKVIDMDFNLTSLRDDEEYNDGITFANIVINGTVTTASELNTTTEVTFTLNDTARPYAYIYIPELRSGQQSVFTYNISSTVVGAPLDITSRYTNPEFETKVLAGGRFNIQLIANNNATVGPLQDVNITLRAENVSVTNASVTQYFLFTLHNLSNDTAISGDYANVDNSSNATWYWTPNGGTINISDSYNISFQIRAPDTVNSSGTFLALTQILAYTINTTASTLNAGEVRARGAVVFNTTKQIVSAQDNLSNRNVTWRSTPYVGTTENITYTLEKVSVWVTTTRDPNQVANNLERDTTVGTDINLTTSYTGTPWYFNFTDGSVPSAPPPIVWVKPYWIIKNTGNQIIDSSLTVNGTDLYMNYIYVINGYWLDVEKRVLDAGNNSFNIKIEVRNRGNGHTPQNLTVTIYDFIPEDFTAFNWSPTSDNSSAVTGEFSGTAYQWDVGLRTNISTSFAPKGDVNNHDKFWINYTVNGTGDFRVSDLYIVGLDPRAVDGAFSHEGLRVIQGIASTSKEYIFLAVVVFLFAINVATFLMTSRINKKLK